MKSKIIYCIFNRIYIEINKIGTIYQRKFALLYYQEYFFDFEMISNLKKYIVLCVFAINKKQYQNFVKPMSSKFAVFLIKIEIG